MGQIRSPPPGRLGARFVNVSGSRSRFAFLAFAGLLLAVSCAVFPDEAILPAAAGAGSGSTSGSSSSAGSADVLAGNGGEQGGPGGSNGAGGMSDVAGAGGVPVEPMGGAGGAATTGGAPGPGGGAGGCGDTQERVVLVTEDTWIDEAKPSTTHGIDKQLSLVGGAGGERRVLLVLPLPAKPAGSELLKATFLVTVEGNADASLAARQLGLHTLTQAFAESRATWLNYDNGGGKKWVTAGGDFGAEFATATLPSNSLTGVLSFDVTTAVDMAWASQAVPLPVIILESGNVPTAPAELAFGSAEGDAGLSLVLQYCQP